MLHARHDAEGELKHAIDDNNTIKSSAHGLEFDSSSIVDDDETTQMLAGHEYIIIRVHYPIQ